MPHSLHDVIIDYSYFKQLALILLTQITFHDVLFYVLYFATLNNVNSLIGPNILSCFLRNHIVAFSGLGSELL